MADIKVYQVFSTPLSKGAIPFSRSDTYTDVVDFNPTKLYWDNTNYRLGIGTGTPNAALDVRGTVIFNDGGGDFDVRMEGDTDANLFFLDAGVDGIGIGIQPTVKFQVEGAVIFNAGNIVFNEDSGSYDFRVESNTNINMLFVDGSADRVGIGTATPGYELDVNGDVACATLWGQAQLQTADDNLFVGSSVADTNFFIDRPGAGGQLIIGHNTPRKIGSTGAYPFTVYDNSTDRQWLIACKSAGSTGGQAEVIINEGSDDIDFRVEGLTDVNLLQTDAANDRVGIGTATPAQKLDVNGITLLRDALYFTQTDGNEKIDSLADGYMDYRATTAHRFGDGTNQLLISAAGVVTLEGTAKRWLAVRPDLDYTVITAQGKPTQVVVGVFHGYSMPIYAAGQELFFNLNVPGRWDEASDIIVHVLVALSGAEDVDDNFKFQLSWEHLTEGDVIPATSHDVPVEQAVLTDRNAQYSTYELLFTLDYDVDGPDDVIDHDDLAMRLRRIDATNPDVTNEIIVIDYHVEFQVNKMFDAEAA